MSSSREERLALNQAMFRDANERMVGWGERHQDAPRETFFCGCADPECRQTIELTASEYEEVRGDSLHFAVVVGHADLSAERVVFPRDRYDVVEKDPDVTALVERTDARLTSPKRGRMKTDEPAHLVVDPERRVARVIVNVEAVDLTVVEPLEKVLRDAAEADVGRLEIDLSGVSLADSNVIRLAMKVREWIAPTGGQVAIKAPPTVRKVFDVTGTSELFEIIEPD